MNNFLQKTTFTIALGVSLTFAACSDAPKGDNAAITDKTAVSEATGQSYIVDTATSIIRFTGRGVGKNHPGTFRVSSGTVAISGNQVTGGRFILDINSLDLDQKEGPIQNKLRPHLLSGDFFDAAKYATAKFEITQVRPYEPNDKDSSLVDGANFNVSGNLTLKDISKNITFPVKIDLDGNTLKTKANFNIDRTQWQINYGNDKTLGDKFISETVNIQLDIRAQKQ